MKIEWATICAEVRQHGATADLVDALADTYEISAALPIEVAPTVALIIQAEIDELSEGGVVAAVYVVLPGNSRLAVDGLLPSLSGRPAPPTSVGQGGEV